jgi:hypothetical protein
MPNDTVSVAEQRVQDLIESAARGENVSHENIQAARQSVQKAQTEAEIQQAIDRTKARQTHEDEVAAHAAAASNIAAKLDKAAMKEGKAREAVNVAMENTAALLRAHLDVVGELGSLYGEAQHHNQLVTDMHTANPVLKGLAPAEKPAVRSPHLRSPIIRREWEVALRVRGDVGHVHGVRGALPTP